MIPSLIYIYGAKRSKLVTSKFTLCANYVLMLYNRDTESFDLQAARTDVWHLLHLDVLYRQVYQVF